MSHEEELEYEGGVEFDEGHESPGQPDTPIVGTDLTDEQIIAFSQAKQIELAQIGMRELNLKSAAGFTALSAHLDSMAKTAQANIKLKAEEGLTGQVAGAAGLLASLFNQIDRNKPLPGVAETPVADREVPALGDAPEDFEFVPGNMDQGTIDLNSDDFMPEI